MPPVHAVNFLRHLAGGQRSECGSGPSPSTPTLGRTKQAAGLGRRASVESVYPSSLFLDACRFTSIVLQVILEAMEDEFVSFIRGGSEGAEVKSVTNLPKPLLARIPKIVWLIVGALIVFAVIFWLYYSRRKQTTHIQKQNELKVVMGQVKDLRDELDTLQQKQTAMMGHLRNVASHSQSVETTLSQALADWTKTFDQLRSEIEIVEDDDDGDDDGDGDDMHEFEAGEGEEDKADEGEAGEAGIGKSS